MEVINAIGRRKSAVARVYLTEGTGKITINKKDIETYFPSAILRYVVKQPLQLLEAEGKYDIKANLDGGGFTGSAGVLLLFLALILRLMHLAERQPYKFGRIYGSCVLSVFLFHLFINVGMVLGLTPVIGIPLPFFSYGGSSLWGFTILLFIFLRIDAGRNLVRS